MNVFKPKPSRHFKLGFRGANVYVARGYTFQYIACHRINLWWVAGIILLVIAAIIYFGG